MSTIGQQAQDDPARTAAGARLRDLIVVGASAGGVEALRELVHGLPEDLPAAMLVVTHMAPGGSGALARVLQRRCALSVAAAEDMEPVRYGRVYVARPDCHLLLRDGEVRLGRGPRENGYRPAVDPLFRSAARWYDSRAIAVVLSGTLDDGAAGALAVSRRGGAVAVQDPSDAMYDGMPKAALRAVSSAVVAPIADMSATLTRLVTEAAPALSPDGQDSDDTAMETEMADVAGAAMHIPRPPGEPSTVSCPDCHGVLNKIDEPALRYRCQVGHAWSPESLEAAKDLEVEDAIWIAVRNLEERTSLYHDLARRARDAGRAVSAARYDDRYKEAQRAAEVIRDLLASGRLGLSDLN